MGKFKKTWLYKKKVLTGRTPQHQGRIDKKNYYTNLANELLDDPSNGLKRVRGVGGMFPPITDELPKETCAEILNYYKLHNEKTINARVLNDRKSMQEIAEIFKITTPIVKRIIYNE